MLGRWRKESNDRVQRMGYDLHSCTKCGMKGNIEAKKEDSACAYS
jgi:hypothetical protein